MEHFDVEPDLIVVAKSIAGGLPLSGVIGRAEIMDDPHDGAIGGTFIGNPVALAAALRRARRACGGAARRPGRDTRRGAMRARMLAWQARWPQIGDVRGLGAMLAIELVEDPETKKPAPDLAEAVIDEALRRGLLLLKAGVNGNCIRVLCPLTTPSPSSTTACARGKRRSRPCSASERRPPSRHSPCELGGRAKARHGALCRPGRLDGLRRRSRSRARPWPARPLLRRDAGRDRANRGTVEKFAGDAVMAVFGAPAALEDHAERALHAALAMQERLAQLFQDELEMRIGVNTGEVVVGAAREGGSFVTGDVVNVADRLQKAADAGEVLAGERTVAAADGAFEFGASRTVEAKGKAGGVVATPVHGAIRTSRARGVGGLPRVFVGRDSELELSTRDVSASRRPVGAAPRHPRRRARCRESRGSYRSCGAFSLERNRGPSFVRVAASRTGTASRTGRSATSCASTSASARAGGGRRRQSARGSRDARARSWARRRVGAAPTRRARASACGSRRVRGGARGPRAC